MKSISVVTILVSLLGCVKQADVREARIEALVSEAETTAATDPLTALEEKNWCDGNPFSCRLLTGLLTPPPCPIVDGVLYDCFLDDPNDMIRWDY
jgi:hypothetical protein